VVEDLSHHKGLNNQEAKKRLLAPPLLKVFRCRLEQLFEGDEVRDIGVVVALHPKRNFGQVQSGVDQHKGTSKHMGFHVGVGCDQDLGAEFFKGCHRLNLPNKNAARPLGRAALESAVLKVRLPAIVVRVAVVTPVVIGHGIIAVVTVAVVVAGVVVPTVAIAIVGVIPIMPSRCSGCPVELTG
jgi:hypothetical protein